MPISVRCFSVPVSSARMGNLLWERLIVADLSEYWRGLKVMKAVNVIKVMNTIENFMFLTNFPPSDDRSNEKGTKRGGRF